MNVIHSIREWQSIRRQMPNSIGFVATMGALHAGHAALLDRSVRENDCTVLSIYVNPTQFNNPEDLTNYPSTLESDLELARTRGADFVLMPQYTELYSDNYRFRVDELGFSQTLCGAHRPGHFTGVLTVVLKLLNIVQPQRAYFGEKDYQQLSLIADMAKAFFLPVEIIPVATVRDADGLALSSRNSRLSPQARRLAPTFSRLLRAEAPDRTIHDELVRAGFTVDYVETHAGRRFGAVLLDCGTHSVRLIDNVQLTGA